MWKEKIKATDHWKKSINAEAIWLFRHMAMNLIIFYMWSGGFRPINTYTNAASFMGFIYQNALNVYTH